jgi:molybdopterin-guanine dinucleotide biosynthesis protein A
MGRTGDTGAGAATAYDAVVLAGGAGRRLGGLDKTALRLGGGAPALERVLAALGDPVSVVVVGPARPLAGSVQPRWARESPVGAGPLAAVAAGLTGLSGAAVVLVMAGDMPLVRPAVPAVLAAVAGEGVDAAVLVDREGVRQPLAAAYRRAWLDARLAALGDPGGRAVRALLDGATVAEVPDRWGAAADFDTWPDRDRIEELLGDD